MALILRDRVRETTTTTGTGNLTLGGASATFDTFASVMSTNDTTYYAIVHTANGTDEWEVGLGTYSGTTLLQEPQYYLAQTVDQQQTFQQVLNLYL